MYDRCLYVLKENERVLAAADQLKAETWKVRRIDVCLP